MASKRFDPKRAAGGLVETGQTGSDMGAIRAGAGHDIPLAGSETQTGRRKSSYPSHPKQRRM
ncbi:hypothetical protein [Paenibacillus cineris]|uniref:hypothetical protein n=1 Tax=Paenibacillus cineris TaxID=237530 RepID=UPI001BB3F385|nr:hypothetical protein [Paenibacillus cineris]